MKLTSIQIVLYIIFIICILLISYYYTNTYTNTKSKYNNKEEFTDNTGAKNALKEEINSELDKLNITDVLTQKKIFNYVTSLAELLPKDMEDYKLAIGLLTNKEQLIREAKSSTTPPKSVGSPLAETGLVGLSVFKIVGLQEQLNSSGLIVHLY